MTLAQIDASQSATGTLATTTLDDRTSTLNSYIFNHYADLTATAYNAYNNLMVFDAERIIATLYRSLFRYGGPLEETPFLLWANRFVTRESHRYRITYDILSEYDKVIHAAIHRNLWTSAVDRAVEHEDIFAEVSALVFQRAHSLNRKGKAKLSTRLTALVKKHVALYHNHRNARRHQCVKERMDAGLPLSREQLSDAELASMKAKPDAWDAGYHECNLLIS